MSEENILINVVSSDQNTIFKQLKFMSPVAAKPAAKDESLKKLKSEIEMLVTSAKSYAYRSPQAEFEDLLVREFGDDEKTQQKIKMWLLKFRAASPHGFTVGKNFNLNYDALVGAKDEIRLELELDRKKQEEEERREKELKDAIRLEKARIAREKKEEERRKKPWLKPNPEKPTDPFAKQPEKQPNFGASLVSGIGSSRRLCSAAFKDTGKFVHDKSSAAQSPFGTFGEKELRLPWEEERKPGLPQRIKIKEKSVDRPAVGGVQPKSAKRIVQELVGRPASHNNTLNKSGSELSLANKKLIPLTSTNSQLGKLKQPPVAPGGTKKDKLLEEFFSKNYTNK